MDRLIESRCQVCSLSMSAILLELSVWLLCCLCFDGDSGLFLWLCIFLHCSPFSSGNTAFCHVIRGSVASTVFSCNMQLHYTTLHSTPIQSTLWPQANTAKFVKLHLEQKKKGFLDTKSAHSAVVSGDALTIGQECFKIYLFSYLNVFLWWQFTTVEKKNQLWWWFCVIFSNAFPRRKSIKLKAKIINLKIHETLFPVVPQLKARQLPVVTII